MSGELLYLADIWIGFLIALPITILLGVIGKYLDFMMDYGSYLWRLRYWIATYYTKRDKGLRIALSEALLQAKKSLNTEDQQDIMIAIYDLIWSKNTMFGRWNCRRCIAGYFALLVALGSTPFVYLQYSIITTIIYFLSILIMPFYFSK